MDYIAAALGGGVTVAACLWGVLRGGQPIQPNVPSPRGDVAPIALAAPRQAQRPPSAAAEAQRELLRVVAAARRTA